ncbi:MAG: hypothetical protein JO093_13485 [Acidobacteria bacterium]|nr:hypothetical protein [Acidobacteriota bacterium]
MSPRTLHVSAIDGAGGVEALRAPPASRLACLACAGWLNNQLGAGNNIGLRIAAMRGRFPQPLVHGPQHERFEDTLPGSEGVGR